MDRYLGKKSLIGEMQKRALGRRDDESRAYASVLQSTV